MAEIQSLLLFLKRIVKVRPPNTETDHTHNNGLVWTGFTDSITREKHTDDGYVIDIGGVDADGNDGKRHFPGW